jgi:hypothetical protein
VEVALSEPLGVGVVRADSGNCRQATHRAVKFTASGIRVGTPNERGRVLGEEPYDSASRGDAARLAVHRLVVRTGDAEHFHVGTAHMEAART